MLKLLSNGSSICSYTVTAPWRYRVIACLRNRNGGGVNDVPIIVPADQSVIVTVTKRDRRVISYACYYYWWWQKHLLYINLKTAHRKNYKQQLVYLAQSRVTDLEGVFLTNTTNDFTFCYLHVWLHRLSKRCKTNTWPGVSLSSHTIIMNTKRLLEMAIVNSDSLSLALTIVNINE